MKTTPRTDWCQFCGEEDRTLVRFLWRGAYRLICARCAPGFDQLRMQEEVAKKRTPAQREAARKENAARDARLRKQQRSRSSGERLVKNLDELPQARSVDYGALSYDTATATRNRRNPVMLDAGLRRLQWGGDGEKDPP